MAQRFESYRLSRRAEIDLADIYAYTVEHWSIEQANRYIADIRAAIEGLVEGIRIGRKKPEVSADYLSYRVGSHVIFYREAGHLLLVARVLHASMDVQRHLPPE